jgi:ABC-2 type transport system permease protein
MNADFTRGRGRADLMLVARRELAVRIRGTAFRVSTILLLAVTVAGIAIASALAGHPQRFTVAVTAQSPSSVTAIMHADAKAAGLQVTTVTAAGRADAVRLVEQGNATAAVAAGPEAIWKCRPDSILQPVLAAAVQQAVVIQRAASLGLSSGAAARLLAPVKVTSTELHAASQRTARTIIAEVGIVLLYLAITFYGSYVLTGVVEEKSSRVAEVLLSRVQPPSLLGGKIAGIGLAGLAQFAAVAAAAVGTLLVTRPSGLPPGTYPAIPMLVVWFVLGYALYSVLYGSLGSLASRTEDAQAAAGPVIALLVAIYIAAVAAIASPRRGLGHPVVPAAADGAHHDAAAGLAGERPGLAGDHRGDLRRRRGLRPVPYRRPALPQRDPAHRRRLHLGEAGRGQPGRPQPTSGSLGRTAA